MDLEVIRIYVVCDEVTKVLGVKDAPDARLSTAEVVAFAIIAARIFGGNHKRARWLCKRLGYFPRMISESQLNRRIHAVPMNLWYAIFRLMAIKFKSQSTDHKFAVDSFPIASCQKVRADRRKLFAGPEYLGYAASKRKYYCGLRVHMIVTGVGQPVEFQIHPATTSDITALWQMELDVPPSSCIYADGAYVCFDLEDILLEDEQIKLFAKRGNGIRNRLRPRDEERAISSKRQIVETAFSCITQMLPRYIRARTEQGFLIRVITSVLAYSLSRG